MRSIAAISSCVLHCVQEIATIKTTRPRRRLFASAAVWIGLILKRASTSVPPDDDAQLATASAVAKLLLKPPAGG